ncbi:MAG: glycyl-radical enzyme activating protein [Planctomycetia bacterium]|nr:glycyl-radical enzyme activating protein [Planctomycetia bacterium]
MPSGIVFEIREFSLFDGPGIRTTVFLKGCPMRCEWCHNPEGQSFAPEILFNSKRCVGCGTCAKVCPSPERCLKCGECAKNCPTGARKLCGFLISSEELAQKLLKSNDIFQMSGGGVTFSGGEPLSQVEFFVHASQILRENGVHVALETSGCVPLSAYRRGVASADLVYQDLKHPFPEGHRRYTGVDLSIVLENIAILKAQSTPFVFRIPVVPGVNDSSECMEAFALLVEGSAGLIRVELLPYHATAGAKYSLVGRNFEPTFDPAVPPRLSAEAFLKRKIPCKIL